MIVKTCALILTLLNIADAGSSSSSCKNSNAAGDCPDPKLASHMDFHQCAQRENENKVLLTMTTFLSKEGKAKELKKSLNSIYEKNSEVETGKFGDFSIDVIVINEYGENGQEKLEAMKRNFPGRDIDWVQKGKVDKGQARSLNIILDKLKKNNYKYWIRWEESWENVEPIIGKAISIMEEIEDQADISFFPADKNWYGEDNFLEIQTSIGPIWRKKRNKEFCEAKTVWDGEGKLKKGMFPFFTLRPSISRVSLLTCPGIRFDEDEKNKAVTFELCFGKALQCNVSLHGGNFDVGKEYVKRIAGHKSTYN